MQEYLRGENLHRDIEYRICLLLAKWYYEQGENTVLGIRNCLKSWAKDNNFYFNVAMNPIATKVIHDDMHLLGTEPVYISRADIEIILDRFDTYYERMVALSVLCYAKAYADECGKFKISQRMLGHWIGFNKKTIHKYIDALIDLGYIEMFEAGETNSWYSKIVVSQLNTYKILVPFINDGEYCMTDNDIVKLYDIIFTSAECGDESWFDIPGYNNWYRLSDSDRVEVCQRMINGRTFPSKILRPFYSASGKAYYNLIDEDGIQRKISLEKLRESSGLA